MVFCNLLSVDGKVALYAMGGTPEDLTGELLVDAENETFEILKEPEKSKVYLTHIGSMLRSNQEEFKKGVFKKRMAHQIG